MKKLTLLLLGVIFSLPVFSQENQTSTTSKKINIQNIVIKDINGKPFNTKDIFGFSK